MQLLEKKVHKTWLMCNKSSPHGQYFVEGSVLGCNTNPHVHSTDLKESPSCGTAFNSTLLRQRSFSLRFRWKIDVSLCFTWPCWAASIFEPESKCVSFGGEVRLVSSSLWLIISKTPWSAPRTCGSESCIMTSRCHDDDLSSAPSATDPWLTLPVHWGHGLLAHHRPLHLYSCPIFSQVAISVKGTPEPWPYNSRLSSSLTSWTSTLNQLTHHHTWSPHRIPNTSPIQTPSPRHSELLSSFPYPKPFFSNISLNSQAHEPTHLLTAPTCFTDGVLGRKTKEQGLRQRAWEWPLLPSTDSTLPLIKIPLSSTEHHTTTRQTVMKNLRWNNQTGFYGALFFLPFWDDSSESSLPFCSGDLDVLHHQKPLDTRSLILHHQILPPLHLHWLILSAVTVNCIHLPLRQSAC